MTRAQQFRSRTEELTLPSGLTCVVRKVNGLKLISDDGRLPDTLTAVLMNSMKPDPNWQPDADQLQEMLVIAERVARAVLVSPKVVDEDPDEDNDEILIYDIEQNDLFYLFNRVMMGGSAAPQVRSFPAKQNGSLHSVPDGDDVSEQTE